MLLNGVDMPVLGGWLSASLTESEIHFTVKAIETSIEMLLNEGILVASDG